jgi:hypothetical protein
MLRTGLLSSVTSLLIIIAASSQTASRKPLPTEPLEKYENPPALAAPAVTISPALVSHFGPDTSYQVNVDANGNNRVGDAANEPSICVDPNNVNRMGIGWRQFDSVASNFREAGFAYTTNGGTRWIAPGVLENNVFRSDPVLNSDTAGRFFISALCRTSLMTCGDQLPPVNHGRVSDRRMAAINSGSRSITPTVPATASNINAGARMETTTAADNSLDQPTAD